jgi:C_GCAxxG_C_C family probable redox protein
MSNQLNDPIEKALARFREGYACSQAVLSAFAGEFGLPDDLALRLSATFGGGMGRLGEVCGAVTGAFMVLGLKAGNVTAEDRSSKERAYRLVGEFVNRFQDRHKTIICRELLGCELSTPEGMQRAKDGRLFTTLCPRVVQDAAEIVSLLLES